MPIDPVSAGSAATTVNSTRTPSSELDKDGFLKLLTEQMRNQDPSSSNDPTQYFQQISMMTMVEQLTNLAQSNNVTRAEGLLGKTVTYVKPHNDPVTGQPSRDPITGVVQGVNLSGTTPTLTVDGIDGIDPSTLTEVK